MKELPFKQVYIDKMKSGSLTYPEVLDPDARDPEFYKRMCEFVYGSYVYNRTFFGAGGVLHGRSIWELRQYARGDQSLLKYKETYKKEGDSSDRRSLPNISWDNTRFFNSLRANALKRQSDFAFQGQVKAVDTAASEIKTKQYLAERLLASEPGKRMIETNGIPDGVNPMVAQMTQADVDTFNMLGGYQLAEEIALKDAIDGSLDMSDWDTKLKQRISEDIFDLGFASAMVFRRPNSSAFEVRYVDPEGLILPYSNEPDFSDAQYKGVIERMSISSLRLLADLDEDKLITAAKSYQGVMGNGTIPPSWVYNNRADRRAYYSAANRGKMPYDDFAVNVLTVYFVAFDAEKYISWTGNKYGNKVFSRVKTSAELTPKEIKIGKRFETVPVQYIYKAKWVVGTDIIFDTGKDDTIVRYGADGSKRAHIPLITVALNEPSMVERSLALIDEVEVLARKLRVFLAKLPPAPRIGIDMALMENSVTFGTDTYSAAEMLGIFFNEGYLLYRSTGEYAISGQEGSNRPPVTPVQIDVWNEYNGLVGAMMQKIKQVGDNIGLNDVAVGTAQTADLLNGVASQMAESANVALYNNIQALKQLYAGVISTIGHKYRIAVLNGNIQITQIPGTSSASKIITLTPDLFKREMHITVSDVISGPIRQMAVQALERAKGEGRIDEAAYFQVSNLILEGDVKKAQFLLSLYVSEDKERKAKEAENNIKLQGEMNKQAAVAAEQEKAKAVSTKIEGQIALEDKKHANRLEQMKLQAQLGIGTLAVQSGLKSE